MRSWKKMSVGLKVSLAVTVILALSVVGVLAAERFDSPNQDEAVQARETGLGADEPSDDVKAAGKTLELGTVAKISADYRVAVTDVARYESAQGQLVVATVAATYIGKQDGEPWADLNVEFFGSGSRSYGESDCPAGLGHSEASDQPVLSTGDKETYDVCMVTPVKDIKSGKVLVEEAFSNEDRTFWSTKEVVTKSLPSVAPSSPAKPATAAPRRWAQQSSDNDRSDACDDFDDDEYQRQKKYGEYLEDQYQSHKDTLSDDDIDDYKDWKKDHDKMMDYYEQWHEDCG